MTAAKQYYGTGRRKSAVARVFLRPGTGDFLVNDKKLTDYFPNGTLSKIILMPLDVVNRLENFNVMVTVSGGGISGQAGAVRLGISRALVSYDESENLSSTTEISESDIQKSFRRILRSKGFLTRDSRKVERKKVGLHKARKRPQYSKR